MPCEIDGVVLFTRSDFRRLRPGRGPARSMSIRVAPYEPTSERIPLRTLSGRFLYTVACPLPLPPAAHRPSRLRPRGVW